MPSPYDTDLDHCPANFEPLTPLTFFRRARDVFAHRPAYVYGETKRSWGEIYERCCRFASALDKAGIGKNDTVADHRTEHPRNLRSDLCRPDVGRGS